MAVACSYHTGRGSERPCGLNWAFEYRSKCRRSSIKRAWRGGKSVAVTRGCVLYHIEG